jgi:hypothetical protein
MFRYINANSTKERSHKVWQISLETACTEVSLINPERETKFSGNRTCVLFIWSQIQGRKEICGTKISLYDSNVNEVLFRYAIRIFEIQLEKTPI